MVVALAQHLAFSCDAAGPATVRRWLEPALRATLYTHAAREALISDALMVTTELVTNAVNAGCSHGWVSWALEPGCLQLCVFDDAAGWPVMRNPGPTEPHGRGLRIIDALASACGTQTTDGGKVAWAALSLPQ